MNATPQTITASSIAARLEAILAGHKAADEAGWRAKSQALADEQAAAAAEAIPEPRPVKAELSEAEVVALRVALDIGPSLLGKPAAKEAGRRAMASRWRECGAEESADGPLCDGLDSVTFAESPAADGPRTPPVTDAGAAPSPLLGAVPAGAIGETLGAPAGVVADVLRLDRAHSTVRLSQLVATSGDRYAEVAAAMSRRGVVVECRFGFGGAVGARAGPSYGR